MARTVVAIYDDFQTANHAVRELVDNGFARDNISIIASNARGEYGYTDAAEGDTVADETGAGAGVGAGIGAAIGGIGGLLVGLGALTIPGIGPVIAAGPLAVALSTLTGAGVGAVAGGVTGGLLGALIGLGIPEEEAEYYAEGVRRGGVLVTVQADETNTDYVLDVLNRHNPVDVNERAAEWREQGWTGFDPNAQPVTSAQMDKENDMYQGTERDVRVTGSDFDYESPVYQNHYNTYLADTGYPYDYYVPAYQYGHGLTSNPTYANRRWEDIEADVHRDWDRQHPGTWERFRNAIRHAWEDVTGNDRNYDRF
jgi:hypothetical protein